MTQELLQKKEAPVSITLPGEFVPIPEHAVTIAQLHEDRLGQLAAIKNTISRKLYFKLEEKLQREKSQLEQLLGIETGQQNQLAKYSFVLDRQYFDQVFLE